MTVNGIDADLFDAVELGNLEYARMLLANPAIDIDAQDLNGRTLVMLAAHYGFTNIVEFLLTLRPNLALRDRAGLDAIDIARTEGHARLAVLLEQAR